MDKFTCWRGVSPQWPVIAPTILWICFLPRCLAYQSLRFPPHWSARAHRRGLSFWIALRYRASLCNFLQDLMSCLRIQVPERTTSSYVRLIKLWSGFVFFQQWNRRWVSKDQMSKRFEYDCSTYQLISAIMWVLDFWIY